MLKEVAVFLARILTSGHSCIRNFWCSRELDHNKTNIRILARKCLPTPTGINPKYFLYLFKNPQVAFARKHGGQNKPVEAIILRILYRYLIEAF